MVTRTPYRSSIAARTASPSSTRPARKRARTRRRASLIASAIPFRYGAPSTPAASGGGTPPPPVDDPLGEPRLRVLLLRVLQVAGEPDVRVLGDRGEPLVERRPRLLHQPMRELELAAVDRADRVGAGADRSTRCRGGPLAGLHARVET